MMIAELTRQNAAAGRTGARANAAARPPELEGEAVHRTLALARVAGARALIYHVTASDAVREIEAAKRRGQVAFGEGALTYLMLTIDAVDRPVSGTALDLGPPLRDEEHRRSLWAGLASGALDIISTDHGPRRLVRGDDGSLTAPPGTSGIEVRLPLTYTFGVRAGHISAAALGRALLHAAGRGLRTCAQGPHRARLRRRSRGLRSRAPCHALRHEPALEHRPLDIRGHRGPGAIRWSPSAGARCSSRMVRSWPSPAAGASSSAATGARRGDARVTS